jgi:predicted dehydrogenase/threonine dehydrogenase-like Zn-dependent dehydrogenase
MKQVLQHIRTGQTTVVEIPDPIPGRGEVLVQTRASLISAGTERYVIDLAKKNLLGKARQRPDQVRRVFQKLKSEGLANTLKQVKAKLDEPMPLGYSAAGVVIQCGDGVSEFKPGDRVACVAPHAGIVSVGKNLCVSIPDGVEFEEAAFVSVAAIAMEGVRLTRASLGERVLVIGLGLIGQMVVSLLKSSGCYVIGTDLELSKLELAKESGADEVGLGTPSEQVSQFTRGMGVDAVVITAATSSDAPIRFAAESCRQRGRIVLVGVAGLTLPREPFFKKELEFTVSSSLGPGRWDPQYEDKGNDYPFGMVRWTAGRNMQAVLDLMATGSLNVKPLISHRFPVEEAEKAYELIMNPSAPIVGVILRHPEETSRTKRVSTERPAIPVHGGRFGVSVIGAGNFARLIMIPALRRIEDIHFQGISSATGVSARHTADTAGFEYATTDVNQILDDTESQAVFIAARHDVHADLVVRALATGKHVFVEKPLCLTLPELLMIEQALINSPEPRVLSVGFNRRFAPATRIIGEFMGDRRPLSISYRFAAGALPHDHWTHDESIGGGRLIGEACHAIDLCVALTGSLVEEVYAQSIGQLADLRVSDDRAFITMRHRDGSLSSVSYQGAGDRAFPKERIEMFSTERVAVVDGWDRVEMWVGGSLRKASGKKDKGHADGFRAFLSACRNGGGWPIPWEHLRNVSWASIAAVRSLREGRPIRYDEMEAGPDHVAAANDAIENSEWSRVD